MMLPTREEQAVSPKVRWARLLVWEGPECNLAHIKEQSVFSTTRQMGGMACVVLSEAELTRVALDLDGAFASFKEPA
jgi:hypothetical protein